MHAMYGYMVPLWVSETAVFACWLAAFTFAVLYTLRARWWATWMGRNLFLFDVAVAAAVTPYTLKYALGLHARDEAFQWLVAGDILFIALLVLHRTVMLLRVQRGWNWPRRRRGGKRNAGER